MKENTRKGLVSFAALTLTALFCGLLIFLFQYLTELIGEFLDIVFEADALNICLYALGIIILSFAEYWLLKGPFFKGEVYSIRTLVNKDIHIHWIRAFVKMFIACLITFMIGIPLGGEGPSVFLCALLAEGIFSICNDKKEDLEGISMGGSVGFSLAFLNPLAGFSYWYEPMKSKPRGIRIVKDLYMILLSFGVLVLMRFVTGIEEPYLFSLYNEDLTYFSADNAGLIFLIPFLAFVLAIVFKQSVKSLNSLVLNDKKRWAFLSTVMAVVVVLCLKFTGQNELLGAGSKLIYDLFSLEDLVFVLAVRYLATALAFDSFYAGGQVIPTISLGYLFGNLVICLLPSSSMTDAEAQLFCILFALCFFSFCAERYWTTVFVGMSFGPVWIVSLYMLVLLPLNWFLGKKMGTNESLATIAHNKHFQNPFGKRRKGVKA